MFYTIEQAKKQVEKLEALKRLEQNNDFKAIILDGYCDAQSDVLVSLLSQAASKQQYKERCEKLKAISYLKQFLLCVRLEGEQAEAALKDPEIYKEMEESK